MNNADIKKNADRILYEFGLLDKLEEFGKAHIIGSYRMDMMAWNDLDIDIENDNMSLDKLYELTDYVLNVFRPIWYEAKEELTPDGKRVWFHGFETEITGELWNADLWFFDKETIKNAERYCDDIASRADRVQKDMIINIKNELIARGLYSFERYRSIDVYKAVIENGARDTEDFLRLFGNR